MPARRNLPISSRRDHSGQSVNKFACYSQIPSVSPLDFLGAGRRRSSAQTAQAQETRERDRETRRRLQAHGLATMNRPPVMLVDLATQGEHVATRDELPRWCVFRQHVAREQAEAHGLLAAYVVEHRPRRVMQLRLRPLGGPVPVNSLREAHLDHGRRVARALEYVARWPGVIPLARATHHRPTERGSTIDLHFHVAVQIDGDDVSEVSARLIRHFVRAGWSAWISDDQEREATQDPAPTETEGSAAALAAYLRESTERYVEAFDDDHLAEYVRQVYRPSPLHRWQPLGPLRRFAAELRLNGVRPHADEDGRVALRPVVSARPQRRRDAAWAAAGPCVLALRTAWIGDELRPVAVVRGWRGSWQELARRYDLDAAVTAARAALATSSFTTATPESSFVRQPIQPRSTVTISPPRHPPPSHDDDAVPW